MDVGVGHVRIATTVSRFGNLSAAFATASGVMFAAIAEQDRGVGHVSADRDEEDPVAPVMGADGLRRYAVPHRIVPERGQGSEYGSKPPRKER